MSSGLTEAFQALARQFSQSGQPKSGQARLFDYFFIFFFLCFLFGQIHTQLLVKHIWAGPLSDFVGLSTIKPNPFINRI